MSYDIWSRNRLGPFWQKTMAPDPARAQAMVSYTHILWNYYYCVTQPA